MTEEKKQAGRKPKHDPQLNKPLFDKYILPNLDEIRSLVFFYSTNKQEVDSNYNYVLTEMYKYIHTYNPKMKLKTWLHIVAKRTTQNQDKERYKAHNHDHGLSYDFDHDNGEDDDVLECGGGIDMVVGNVIDNVSDKVLSALQRTPPALLSSFILYYQGYTQKEIVDIEYKRGYIDHTGPDACKTIQNRIYMAKKVIKKILADYGITKTAGNG